MTSNEARERIKELLQYVKDDCRTDFASHYERTHVQKGAEPNDIMALICSIFGVTEEEIKGKSRVHEICFARHMFCYASRMYTSKTYSFIGSFLNRNHATAIHAFVFISNFRQAYATVYHPMKHKVELVISSIELNMEIAIVK